MLRYVVENPGEFSKDPNQMMLDVEGRNIRIFGFFGLVEQARRQGYLYPDCHYFRIEAVMPDRGTALVNTVRVYDVDGTNPADVTRAEIEGRRQQRLLLEFARKFVPGFEKAYVLGFGEPHRRARDAATSSAAMCSPSRIFSTR